ncbi:hypothetical protein I553_4929 [Mycobacterium xenopi 4042]|uniref:Uncharacterized protein n=1 Tax=Mycobacterium xenopi 4042 TaxID=1299334 RepID=X8AFI0_MYCXE|nr:hypothetical protein I553_4929 [Mycobacterium xenopi 4042]
MVEVLHPVSRRSIEWVGTGSADGRWQSLPYQDVQKVKCSLVQGMRK